MRADHAGNALNFQQLQALGSVREHGSISAAAAELYLTPSAVSQQLQALATNCGFEIVERRGRTVRLTRRGLALAALADEVFSRWERGLESLSACGDQPRPVLRMGALTSAYRSWLGPAVSRIRATAGVDLELLEVDPDKVSKYLADGVIDMAVSVHIPRELPSNFQRFPLYSDTFAIVGTIPDPTTAGGGLAALKDACWVLPESRTYSHEIIAVHCAAAGFAPHPIARSNDWVTIQSMTASLDAVAFVPQSCLIDVPGLCVYEIGTDILPAWPVELVTLTPMAHKAVFNTVHESISQLAPTRAVL